jgi:tetratricopeptide (TPR) repeat protein
MGHMVWVLRLSYFWSSFILLLMMGAYPSSSASAESKTSNWKAREMAAKKFCNVGEYQKGIEILGDLYVETNISTYLFNQGRCYQQNDQYEKAIARFREYLRKSPGISPAEKLPVDEHIADCQTQLQKLQPLPAPADTISPTVKKPPPAMTKPDLVAIPAMPPTAPLDNEGKGLRIAGLITGSVGLIGLGVGGAIFWEHNRKVEEYDSMAVRPDDAESNLQQLKTLSLVGFGVGGAAVLTGVIMYYFGWKSHASTAISSAVVVPTPEGMCVVLKGTFNRL